MTKHFNLADLFEMVSDAVPDREALVCGQNRISFIELESRSNQLAHYLSQKGVTKGQHVGLYLYNCNEYIEAMLACFKIRAVPININYRYVESELAYIFDNAHLVACISPGGREGWPRPRRHPGAVGPAAASEGPLLSQGRPRRGTRRK